MATINYGALKKQCNLLQNKLRLAEQELDALRPDAGRYRWLRDFGYMNVIPADTASLRDGRGPFAMLIHPSADGNMTLVLNNESLDSAIDAQMRKGE